ncbi:hypothetical protein ACIRRH_43035 [Kitasatospora sp. NPDC101235]|uniref:hypothetical protein n=1 Tax=Kitasatospora sp. NPDC101235 TaxID=3364101 RepID=UPI0037F380A7
MAGIADITEEIAAPAGVTRAGAVRWSWVTVVPSAAGPWSGLMPVTVGGTPW